MASTPQEPSGPEDDKLELPRFGGLLRRRKKDAQQDDTEGPAPEQAPEVEETEPELVGVELGSEADDDPEQQPTAELVDQSTSGPATGPATEPATGPTTEPASAPGAAHGPDLVAPATAYTQADPDQPVTRQPRRPRLPTLPRMPALPALSLPVMEDRYAVPLTGVVVGLTGVLLTYLLQLGCGVVRGAGSCGGAGLALLIVVLVLMVFMGAALMRAWFVEEPLTTSFLAVAVVAVVSMLVLLPIIDRWFMVIVIPVVSAAAYTLSWFVTSRFDAPEREAARERENAR